MDVLNLVEQLGLNVVASLVFLVVGQPVVPPVANAAPVVYTVPMPPARPEGIYYWGGKYPLPVQNNDEVLRFVG